MRGTQRFVMALIGALALALATTASPLNAHCDGLDGPVVKAAERALAAGNLRLVLIWVQPSDEAELQAAFKQAVAVRRLGPEAQQLADRSFFETLVRLHRAGEGAPYTGLKPAGRDLGPAIPAADRAIELGRSTELDQLLVKALQDGLRERYQGVLAARRYDPNDVNAGRAYVAKYVEFIHYVERLYDSATQDAHGHAEEGQR